MDDDKNPVNEEPPTAASDDDNGSGDGDAVIKSSIANDDDQEKVSGYDEDEAPEAKDNGGKAMNDNDENASSDDEDSENSSDSSGDDSSISDNSEDEDVPNDGISDYERLRLERIKRNQERLAALGLQDAALKPKKIDRRNSGNKPKRRRSTEPSVATRERRSRTSKKRIDYAEMPAMHASPTTPKEKRELTPAELAKRDKRRKEKRHNDRIPRFVYDEFQRIRRSRKVGLKKAKRHLRNSERERNHWHKVSTKLTVQEHKQAVLREKKERQKREQEERLKLDEAERKELDCRNLTKRELLREIELRSTELWGILVGHDREESVHRAKQMQQAREREEVEKRKSLERKLSVIDALDRFPKATNEALTKLNGLLYARAPKDLPPPRRSVRRTHEMAFGASGTTAVASTGKSRGRGRPSTKSAPPKVLTRPSSLLSPKEPLKKKTKLTNSLGDTSASASTIKKKDASGGAKKKKTGLAAAPAVFVPTSVSSSPTRKKKRGRPRKLALPMHSSANLPSIETSVLANLVPPQMTTSIVPSFLDSKTIVKKTGEVGETIAATTSANITKRARKPRDARYVGGWISPKFSHELDRTWLERTKPIDNRPVVVVPDDACKLAGVPAKKTAVFDLGSYVPQAGDILLYYPSAHKDVLNVYPDTLGSRQRNLLRVPLWARANRDRNRLSKEDDHQKGTIWWTDEWVESLLSPRSRKKDSSNTKVEGSQTSDSAQNGQASLGDYPIICRVEKTYAEFPEDPYAKQKPTSQSGNPTDTAAGAMGDGGSSSAAVHPKMAVAKRLTAAAAEAKKKRASSTPRVRLAIILKALSPVVAPSGNSGLASGGLGLAPNFTVVTFPVRAPLEPFLVPFCWAYSSFHTMVANETVWIRRASNADNDVGSISDAISGKGKIVDFLAGANAKESKSKSRTAEDATGDKGLQDEISSTTGDSRESVRLAGNFDELTALVRTLTRDENLPQAIAAAMQSEKDSKGTIPIREASIIVDFFRRYLEHFQSKSDHSVTTLLSSSTTQELSSPEAATHPPSLVDLILKTLPLRRGVLVTYDSNRRQSHRASPWNLVTLQPTDLSRSLQDGLLGYLENSLREKTILCMKDLIDNSPGARHFVPMVTELIAPAYYCAVPVGMSFDRILARLKAYGNTGSCYYTSMESILMDLNLVSENCLLYNNPESELVAYCSDIVSQCQTLIKNIIQNRSPKSSKKIADSDIGVKRQALAIPSFLNTPFKGKLNWDWLQQISPHTPGTTGDGEKATRQALALTWIPQCGESIFYSKSNHLKFVNVYHDSLEDVQSFVPDFDRADIQKENGASEEIAENKTEGDEFLAKLSSHWLEGTVVSVRTSFPRPLKIKNEGSTTTVTPILVLELHLHHERCEGNIFVCWRPTFEGNKCKGSGLVQDSFLKPAWISTDGMNIFPSNSLQASSSLSISEDMSTSITKCFDLLKQRCLDGIPPDAINPDLALENAERGGASNFSSDFLPSYQEFFTPSEAKYGTRGIKKADYKATLRTLSNVGYMPVWSVESLLQNKKKGDKPRHELWMAFPSLCLELIRLRISSGYYKNLLAVVNDICESYVGTVLFLLSESWTRSPNPLSIRKIAKHMMSPRRNGKMSRISVKKKSKKKMIEDSQADVNQTALPSKKKSKGTKELQSDKLNEEEEALVEQIFQIRKYHAVAIVFALESSHAEKIFCLTSTTVSKSIPDEIPDIDPLKASSFTPDQLRGVAEIRRLLHAVGRDPCRNRFKISYLNTYKIKIKCGDQFIAENGQLERANDDSILFEPSFISALLQNGSQMKLRVRCGNKDIYGEKRIVTDQHFTEVQLKNLGSLPQTIDPNKCYHSSSVGRNFLKFNSEDFMKNEDLVRSLFGRPGRMHPCVRCQAYGGSLYSCRVQRQHSNPDYDLIKSFKGSSGVDSLLLPWKKPSLESKDGSATTKANVPNRDGFGTNIEQNIETVDASTKEAEEKELAATLAKEASEARENFEKADKANKLARYLYDQAILLSSLEVKLSKNFISANFPVDPSDNHYVFCIHCGCAGDLLVCESCPNVSKLKCAGLTEVPEGKWYCDECVAKRKSNSNAILSSEEINGESLGKRLESNGETKETKETSSENDSQMIATTESTAGNSTCCSSNATSNHKTSEPDSNDNSTEKELHIQKIEDNSQVASTDTTANTDVKNQEVSEFKERSEQASHPEINDTEFEKKELELEKLMTELCEKRVPTKVKPNSNSNPNPIEQQEQFHDPMDALTEKYIREFLSSLDIDSAEKLLNTKSGFLARDLEVWRREKGLKPFAMSTCNTAVSTWKNLVRNAIIQSEGQANRKEGDKSIAVDEGSSRKNSENNLELLPPQARKFCSYLGISDAETFLGTKASELARKYASWRKKQGMSRLAGSGPSVYIGSWKNKIRKELASAAIEVEDDGPVIPKGFKVRKLFEDGNYYEGQVISGPTKVLDEESGTMVLCWRVKYLDDDEEEFDREELNMWGVDNNHIQESTESGISTEVKTVEIVDEKPKLEDSAPLGRNSVLYKDRTGNDSEAKVIEPGKAKSVEISPPAKTDSINDNSQANDAATEGVDRKVPRLKEMDTPRESSSAKMDSTVKDDSARRKLPRRTASARTFPTGNSAIGKKVKDLEFAISDTTDLEEDEKRSMIDTEVDEKSTTRLEEPQSESEENVGSGVLDSSLSKIKPRTARRRNPRQLSVLDEKTTDKISEKSFREESPIEERKHRHSTRNPLLEQNVADRATPEKVSSRSGGRRQRTSARTNAGKQDTASLETASRDTRTRRSTRALSLNEGTSPHQGKQTKPKQEVHRRSNRLSR